MKYERLTDEKFVKAVETCNMACVYGENCIECVYFDHNSCPETVQGRLKKAIPRLAELEDKIEQGTLIAFKFARNQEVYYIGYVTHAYHCPHCGEECYEEKVKGVEKGIICERIITDNQDGMDIIYTIQIEEKSKLKMFTKREENSIFLTREEAEKRLKELQE